MVDAKLIYGVFEETPGTASWKRFPLDGFVVAPSSTPPSAAAAAAAVLWSEQQRAHNTVAAVAGAFAALGGGLFLYLHGRSSGGSALLNTRDQVQGWHPILQLKYADKVVFPSLQARDRGTRAILQPCHRPINENIEHPEGGRPGIIHIGTMTTTTRTISAEAAATAVGAVAATACSSKLLGLSALKSAQRPMATFWSPDA